MICKQCEGSGWVCENHPNKPMEHYFIFFGFKFVCGGAGRPCQCNKANPSWNFIEKFTFRKEENQ